MCLRQIQFQFSVKPSPPSARIFDKIFSVQKKQIAHPFHKIAIDYDESKPWTARDEKLLKLYLQLHDTESQRHATAQDLMKKYGELEKGVEAVRKELKQVKDKLKATRDAADHVLAQINLHVPNVLEKFTQSVNETNDAIQDYDKKLRALEVKIKKLHALKDKYHDEEEEDSLWDRLSELKITYAYDTRLAIDYVSFDDDEERFREKASFMSRENERYLDYCSRVTDNYNKLLVETEVQYEVWGEFGRRMKLIEHVTGRDSGYTEISRN